MSLINKRQNPFDDPEGGDRGGSFLLASSPAAHSNPLYAGDHLDEARSPAQLPTLERRSTILGRHSQGPGLSTWRDHPMLMRAMTVRMRTYARRSTQDTQLEPEVPRWRQALGRGLARVLKLYRGVMESTFVGAVTDILDVFLCFVDIFTDIEVVKVLHANHHTKFFILTIVFITAHYFVMGALVAKYISRTWGRKTLPWLGGEDSAARGMWWILLAPFMVPVIPVLDCFMILTSVVALVAPRAYVMGSFLSNFNFSRVFIEFALEAIPQTALQVYMVFHFQKQSTQEEKYAVVFSLAVSVLEVVKHSWRLRVAARAAGMSLPEYFKYLLLLKGNFVVPKAVKDIQISETCCIADGTLTINGLHLHKNKSKFGPAQQAHILVSAFAQLGDQGLAGGINKLVLGGCPLNAINGIIIQGLRTLKVMEVLEVNECSFRGETFSSVAEAIRKHKTLSSVRVCQTGLLGKYRNHRCGEVVRLFSRRLRLCTLTVSLPWWDVAMMEKAAKKLSKHRHMQNLTIEFPSSRAKAAVPDSAAELLQADREKSHELDARYGGAVSLILQRSVTLSTLNLINHQFGEEAMQLIARALELNATITSLSLRGSTVGARGATALARVLKGNARLSVLNLRRCQVHGEGVSALAAALVDNSTLRSLDLSNNRVLPDRMQYVAQALRHNSTLQVLKLEGWREAFEDASSTQALSMGLAGNRSLRTLSLADCAIGDSGATALSSALGPATALTSLDISMPGGINARSMRIGDLGLVALAAGLARSRSLQVLNLRGATFGVDGARAFGEAIACCKALKVLDLTACGVSNDQLGYLGLGVARSTTLETVKLGQLVDVDMVGMRALSGAVRDCKSLKMLDISYSRLAGDDDVLNAQLSVVAGALGVNSTLTDLNLAYVNRITESGAAALAAVLTQNSTLKNLNLEGYSTEAAVKVFDVVMKENTALESLPTTNSLFSMLDIVKNKNKSNAERSFSGSLPC